MRLTAVLLISVSLFSCEPHGSSIGLSRAVKQSKAIDAFVFELMSNNEAIMAHDTLYTIEEIWVEKLWKYIEGKPEVVREPSFPKYQLQVNFNEEGYNIYSYRKTWELRLQDGTRFRRSGNHSLVASLSESPNDTLVVNVWELSRPFSHSGSKSTQYKFTILK